jgi:hypothetical protein
LEGELKETFYNAQKKCFQKQVASTQDRFKNSSKLSALFLLNAQLAPSHVAV